jgi:hypothetical protein
LGREDSKSYENFVGQDGGVSMHKLIEPLGKNEVDGIKGILKEMLVD